ncbi:MAG: glycosyltransferase family 4 protein [Aggregatilineales bacterium]
MKILIAAHGFPPTHYAGAERLAERIASQFASRGHTVEVFAVERLNDLNFRVETEHSRGFPVHRVFYNAGTTAPYPGSYDSPQVARAIEQVLERSRFDVIHIISGYLIAVPLVRAARHAKIPVVITLTEYWFMCSRLNLLQFDQVICSGPESDSKCAHCLAEEKRRYRFISRASPQIAKLMSKTPSFRRLESAIRSRRQKLQQTLAAADVVISPSQFLIDKFAAFGFNTERFVLIRHGLSAADTSHALATRVQSGTLRLGYTGQIKPHKGVDLIVGAVLPLLDAGHNITLDLWGPDNEDPAYTAALKRRTAAYPFVRWRGRYDRRELWNILASIDALIVPSRCYENSPMVIGEAYVAGLPVVATRLGGMAEMVTHERSGLLFNLNDAAGLSRQIERLITEPDLLPRLRAGIPPVKTDVEEASEILSQYQRLLRRHDAV